MGLSIEAVIITLVTALIFVFPFVYYYVIDKAQSSKAQSSEAQSSEEQPSEVQSSEDQALYAQPSEEQVFYDQVTEAQASQEQVFYDQVTEPQASQEQAASIVDPFIAGLQRATPWGADGGGINAAYLDRHNMDCETEALNQFNYKREGDQLRMNYTCASNPNLGSPVSESTPWQNSNGGNTFALDNLNAECGPGNVMTQLHLATNPDGQWKWEYSCAPSTNPLTCRTTSTPMNDGGNPNEGPSIYLDRHDIKCDTNEAISQMQLVKGDNNNYEIQYTCCQV